MELQISSPKFGIHIVYIDDEDYDKVKNYKWHVNYNRGNVYATTVFKINKKPVTYKLHRLILDFPKSFIDHKDGNGLNNRKSNLRLSTFSENIRNKGKAKRNKSGYKGVVLTKGKYWAYISHEHKKYSGGYFDCPMEAAIKYNEMALKYHGEFAHLNQINLTK